MITEASQVRNLHRDASTVIIQRVDERLEKAETRWSRQRDRRSSSVWYLTGPAKVPDPVDAQAGLPGKPVVLVPYYAAVEKECDKGLKR